MVADPIRRSAARAATLIALPTAVGIGLASFWALGGLDRPASPSAQPTNATSRPASTAPVAIAASPLPTQALTVCRAVVAKLPDAVREARRRPVTAGPEQNAAYGDPPILVSCGATIPAITPTADVWPLSGVCWYADVSTTGTVWTTLDRQVAVSVTVPGDSAGSAQSVIPFSPAIAAGDPPLPNPPTGCAN